MLNKSLKGNVLILNYHSIIDDYINKGHLDPIYSIRASKLKEQFELISKHHLNVVTLDEFDKLDENETLNICLTFDDGHTTDYEVVYPILNEFGFKASFFISVEKLMKDEYRWDQYRELKKCGNTIGSHGVSHRYLVKLNEDEQIVELEKSKNIIENKINTQIHYFALPGGRYNNTIIRLAKQSGCKGLLSTDFGYINIKNIPYLLNRWSIKTSSSLKLFEGILNMQKHAVRKMKLRTHLKKQINSLLGNATIDRLNYWINS